MEPTSPSPLILIVDDVEITARVYGQMLEFSGFQVEHARDGLEALTKATVLQPAAVLLDLEMPGLGGFEVLKRLRSDERTAAIPVVVITGHSNQNIRRSAREAGCSGFLVKPCRRAELTAELRRLAMPGGTSIA